MQQRPERAVDQRSRFVQLELAHVAFAEVERHACGGRSGTRLLQHRR